MTTRIIKIKEAIPTSLGDTGAPTGVVMLKPTRRRDVDDTVVLPATFGVSYGAALMDGDTVVRAATPGIAWAQVEVTDTPPTWGWEYWEHTREGSSGCVLVPAGPDDVPLTELQHVDPDTFDPIPDAPAAWYAALEDAVPSDGTPGHVLTKGVGGENEWTPAGSGSGDVVGPASSIDNRIARMDGATGKQIQQSLVTIDDDGAMTGMSTVDGRDLSVDGTKLDGIAPGATANATDAQLRDRATHTGTQPANTITGLAPVATSGDYDDLTGKPTALPPSGAAGGVLAGTYPNPSFAADMATQAELDAEAALARNADNLTSGTVADARIPAGITRDSELAAVATSGSASDITTGTLPTSVLPPLAVNEVFVVASQAAMLALTAQRGDMAIRTDNGKTYVLSTDSPGTLADWKEILAAGQVQSVNGETGVVVLDKADVGLGNVDNTADADKPISTATQTALDGKQALDADLTAIAALAPANDDVLQRKAGAWTNRTPAQVKADLALTKDDVGLSNVDDVQQQPLDSDLTTIAGLTPTTDNFMQAKANAWASRTPAQVKTDLALPADTVAELAGKQPLDSDLTTIAGLAATTDNVIQSVGSAWASRTPAQLKATLALTKGDVGLGNVDNTSNATERAAVATLTNKRITKRVLSTADTATLTIDADSYDAAKVTALAQAMTIAAPTGTPTAMQSLIIRIKDNGTARALTWNAAFRAIGVTLPTTTVLGKTTYVGLIWNSDDSKWDAIAVATQA